MPSVKTDKKNLNQVNAKPLLYLKNNQQSLTIQKTTHENELIASFVNKVKKNMSVGQKITFLASDNITEIAYGKCEIHHFPFVEFTDQDGIYHHILFKNNQLIDNNRRVSKSENAIWALKEYANHISIKKDLPKFK